MILALILALAGQVADSVGTPRRVEGRVVLGTRERQIPLANQWVVLHRVGRDRSGPLDSTRTTADGRFTFRYQTSGDTMAIYFATTSRGGIVYPTSPFRLDNVSGDAASITVFDTTSAPIRIGLGGRHLIVGAPNPNGGRPVGEVYDLENDSTVTLIPRDSTTPVWTARIPPQATGFQVNTAGETATGAVSRNGTAVGLFIPLSPGIRQIGFTYDLPPSAFPLTITAEEPIGVFEVLIQEPTAHVQGGATLREMAPVSTEGRVFRRFLAQDLQRGAVLRVDVPRVTGATRDKVYMSVAFALAASMGVAAVYAFRRRPQGRVVAMATTVEPRSQALVREIATLDDEFDRTTNPDDAARAAYAEKRASLKRELSEAVAAEHGVP